MAIILSLALSLKHPILLGSTIAITLGLAALTLVTSSKGHHIIAAFLSAGVWLLIAFSYLVWRFS